jgi:hypothetical protein
VQHVVCVLTKKLPAISQRRLNKHILEVDTSRSEERGPSSPVKSLAL